jgi:hypothetical protein
MPSRKSADSRSARFASDPVSTVQDEQTPSQENSQIDDVVSEVIVPGEVSEPVSVDSIVEPGQLALDLNQETVVLPSSNIIRQPWKKENKQQKSYLGWAMSSVSNMMSFNVVLSVVAVGLAYYFFMYRKRGVPSKNVPEVEEQGERKSEGPKSVRSSLKFKSPTMILSEIRKNPSVKVAPTISKK